MWKKIGKLLKNPQIPLNFFSQGDYIIMRIRFLTSANLKKTLPNGTDQSVPILHNQTILASRVIETEDPEFVDIYVNDGVLNGINRNLIAIYNGGIEAYQPPVLAEVKEEEEDDEE